MLESLFYLVDLYVVLASDYVRYNMYILRSLNIWLVWSILAVGALACTHNPPQIVAPSEPAVFLVTAKQFPAAAQWLLVDLNGDDYWDEQELSQAFLAEFKQYDSDGDGLILTGKYSTQVEDELLVNSNAIDWDRDGNGQIDPNEFSINLTQHWLHSVDHDGDQKISKEEAEDYWKLYLRTFTPK